MNYRKSSRCEKIQAEGKSKKKVTVIRKGRRHGEKAENKSIIGRVHDYLPKRAKQKRGRTWKRERTKDI